MATPIGHAAVGLSTAIITARLTHTPIGPEVLAGAVIASGLPDLDFVFTAFGHHSPKFHRNATHSLLMLTLVALAGVWIVSWTGWVTMGVYGCWVAAGLSHPWLDIVTTPVDEVKKGWGIPLLWPFSRRRFATEEPWVPSGDLRLVRSLREVWVAVRPELAMLCPASALAALLAVLFLP